MLVDRLWPRGVSKESSSLDAWMKEVAPSSELRRWFGHDATLPARLGLVLAYVVGLLLLDFDDILGAARSVGRQLRGAIGRAR